ncbi:MAG: transposase, partial [Planctomycetota bacterium]|nr:transposase [Planctomycetota bacterium]
MKATGVESTEKAIWFEIIRIAEGEIHRHLDKMVRGTVEEVLNRLLEEKGAKLAGAERYERREQRRDYRNGRRKRKLMAKAGE